MNLFFSLKIRLIYNCFNGNFQIKLHLFTDLPKIKTKIVIFLINLGEFWGGHEYFEK